MTTIAANRKSMSGDSRVSGGGPIYYADKIFRIGDSIVGVAGDAKHTTKFLAWFRTECPPTDEKLELGETDSFCALVLNSRGLFYYFDLCEPDHLHNKFYAVGSGSLSAMADMRAGKTTEQAVRGAMEFDEQTGGRVKTLTLGPTKRKLSRPSPVKSQTDSAPADQLPPKG
jgi:hypothetical protein